MKYEHSSHSYTSKSCGQNMGGGNQDDSLAEPGACFSKVPKLFGPILGTTIPFMSSQRRGSKPSNFAILLIFLILKACGKIIFSKRADCSLTTSFSGPKSSRDVRETGPSNLNFATYF